MAKRKIQIKRVYKADMKEEAEKARVAGYQCRYYSGFVYECINKKGDAIIISGRKGR